MPLTRFSGFSNQRQVHQQGTIEVGKFADLIVVDQDPLNIDKNKLKHIKVKMRFLGGKLTTGGDMAILC